MAENYGDLEHKLQLKKKQLREKQKEKKILDAEVEKLIRDIKEIERKMKN
jgi:hypothetical protein